MSPRIHAERRTIRKADFASYKRLGLPSPKRGEYVATPPQYQRATRKQRARCRLKDVDQLLIEKGVTTKRQGKGASVGRAREGLANFLQGLKQKIASAEEAHEEAFNKMKTLTEKEETKDEDREKAENEVIAALKFVDQARRRFQQADEIIKEYGVLSV